MGKVICFASSKGGSGKTTVVASTAQLLTEFGATVLMVDFDEATNGLSLLYIHEIQTQYEDFKEAFFSSTAIFPIDGDMPDVVEISSNLSLIPASFTFKMNKQHQSYEYKERITDVLSRYSGEFDYILIDAQAGSDAASLAAISIDVSDLVILVSEYDPMSAAGIERLKGLVPSDLSFDRTYILINKMLPEFIESFTGFFSVSHYLPPVPWTSEAVRAYSKRKVAINTEDGNDFTLALIQSVKSFPIPSLQEAYSEWIKKKAPLLRQPIDEQYKDAEALLEASTIELYSLQEKEAKLKASGKVFSLAGIIAGVALFFSSYRYIQARPGFDNLQYALQVFVGFGIFLFVIAIVLGLFVIARSQSSQKTVRRRLVADRISRQREVYRERLKELEFLRAASDKDLIEQKFRVGRG